MSPQDKTDKTDLGAKVDSLLGSWPAPPLDDAAWEERATSIVAAAQAAPRADDAALTALLAPPPLSPEAGEAERSTVVSGEKKMSQDSNAGSGSSAKPPESMPMSAATSKRPSLKELAARASQAGASRSSIPGSPASIPPAAPSDAPPAPVTRTPLPSAPPKAAEANKEDSGVVDLNLINKTATAEQVAAAEKAKPATHDLAFDGDDKVAAANDAGKVASLAAAREKKAEKKGGGATWGILVAVVGIAAGVAIVMRGQTKPNTPTANVGQEKPAVAAEAPKAVEQQKIAEAPPPAPTGLSLDSLPTEPSPAEAQKGAQPTAGAAGGDPGKAAAATPPAGGGEAPKAPAGPAPTVGEKPGDLAGAMAQAVGGSTEKGAEGSGEMVPAAGGNKGNQTIPEQPSQGSVASAVGSVMPGAKACVAGADDVSRAQITFSSGGTVSNVSVTGWAASNGQSGCVKSALKAANVGAFSKPSFTVGVTIRP